MVGSGFSDGSRLETRDISGSCWLTSPGLFDAGFALRWKRRYAAGSAMLRRLHSL